MIPRRWVLVLAGVALLGALIAVVLVVLSNASEDSGLSATLRSDPDVAAFLASDAFPSDVKDRYVTALRDGGLHPQRLLQSTNSWRACSQRCTGMIKYASRTSITLVSVLDGKDWTIDVSDVTQVSRGGKQIRAADLRQGELVEALSQDGKVADIIISYSEPLRP